jgi:hypothetical protein
MFKHTPEPWQAESLAIYADINGHKTMIGHLGVSSESWVEGDTCDANARRIVACVNACAAIATERLEACDQSDAKAMVDLMLKWKDQRDELLAAAKELMAAQAHYDELDAPGSARLSRLEGARESLNVAIAKAEAV